MSNMLQNFGMQNFSSGSSRSAGLQSDYQPTPSSVQRSNFLDNLTDTKDGLGINMERPKFPQYAVQTTRIASFKNWPVYLNQTPELLAESGFVYGGVADSVRCFFCGGGLRNWDPEDNPWEEHARWYPKCGHVRLCKGEDFIRRVNAEDAEDDELVPDIAVAQSAVRKAPAVANDIMNSVPVLSVLEWEKDLSKVKKAVEIAQMQGKRNFVARDLMEILYSMEEDMDTTPSASSLPPQREPVTVTESVPKPTPLSQVLVPQTQVPAIQPSVRVSEPSVSAVQCSKAFEPESKPIPEQTCVSNIISESDELLLEENRRLQEQHLCKICLDERACIVFLPCGHMVSCPQCAPAMRKCPICRTNIKGTVKAYMA